MKNEMELNIYCKKCIEEKPRQLDQEHYNSLEIAWNIKGFHIWCERHNTIIARFKLEGSKLKIITFQNQENDE